MKSCSKCKRELDESRFVKDSGRKSGLYPSCKDCSRSKNKTSRINRTSGLEWCKICEQRPKLPYHQYCHICKLEYQNRTRSKKCRERYPGDEQRRIEAVRHYATNLLKRGKIKRGACVFCGLPGQHFHHFDYERKTRNFVDVCIPCHVGIHQILETVLTFSRYRAIQLPAA